MMTRRRWLLIGAAVLMIAGCASGSGAPTAPPSVNVTGKWAGSWQFSPVSAGSGQVSMDLTQTGADVTGTTHVSGPAVNQPTTVRERWWQRIPARRANFRHVRGHGRSDDGNVSGVPGDGDPDPPEVGVKAVVSPDPHFRVERSHLESTEGGTG